MHRPIIKAKRIDVVYDPKLEGVQGVVNLLLIEDPTREVGEVRQAVTGLFYCRVIQTEYHHDETD